MYIPRAEFCRPAERHRDEPGNAEEAEPVVHEDGKYRRPDIQLVVVGEADAYLQRHGDRCFGARVAGRCADLEVASGLGAAIGLPAAGCRVELEGNQRVRLDRRLLQIAAVVDTNLERNLLDGRKGVVRARVRGIGRAEARATGETKSQRRVEIRLVPQLARRTINAGIARADKTLRNVTGAWVKSQKVVIEKGKITEYRVLMKVSFILQDK